MDLFGCKSNNNLSTLMPLSCYHPAMASIEQKRKKAKKHLAKHRKKLMKQGLCRDCGLRPAVKPEGETPKRKPTLCEECRKTRREAAARARAEAKEGMPAC
jgi:hypothetical protein